MREARDRVFAACRDNRIALFETCTAQTIAAPRRRACAIAGHRAEIAIIDRHQQRGLPV